MSDTVQRRRAPWDFSIPKEPADAVPNVPTLEGAALGRELARLVDVAEAENLQRFPNQIPRCDDCAFRLGTTPNQCAPTLMDAVKCLVESEPFYCHKGVREGEAPRRLCTGWMVLANEDWSGAAKVAKK